MMKNALYVILKVLFFRKIFFSWLFGHVKNQFDENGNVNFKMFEISTWLTNTLPIAHCLTKER